MKKNNIKLIHIAKHGDDSENWSLKPQQRFGILQAIEAVEQRNQQAKEFVQQSIQRIVLKAKDRIAANNKTNSQSRRAPYATWELLAKQNGFADIQAVKDWQTANDLESDGKLGNKSLAKLRASKPLFLLNSLLLNSLLNASIFPLSLFPLSLFSSKPPFNPDVTEFTSRNYSDYGFKSEDDFKAWQRASGLDDTGHMGPKSRAELQRQIAQMRGLGGFQISSQPVDRYGNLTPECAAYVNGVLQSNGIESYGNSYAVGKKRRHIINGYSSSDKPVSMSSQDVLDFQHRAADRINLADTTKLDRNHIYTGNMYYNGSGHVENFYKNAQSEGSPTSATHTSVIYFDQPSQTWKVSHNIHQKIHNDNLKDVIGAKTQHGKYGITAIADHGPGKNGGFLDKAVFTIRDLIGL